MGGSSVSLARAQSVPGRRAARPACCDPTQAESTDDSGRRVGSCSATSAIERAVIALSVSQVHGLQLQR